MADTLQDHLSYLIQNAHFFHGDNATPTLSHMTDDPSIRNFAEWLRNPENIGFKQFALSKRIATVGIMSGSVRRQMLISNMLSAFATAFGVAAFPLPLLFTQITGWGQQPMTGYKALYILAAATISLGMILFIVSEVITYRTSKEIDKRKIMDVAAAYISLVFVDELKAEKPIKSKDDNFDKIFGYTGYRNTKESFQATQAIVQAFLPKNGELRCENTWIAPIVDPGLALYKEAVNNSSLPTWLATRFWMSINAFGSDTNNINDRVDVFKGTIGVLPALGRYLFVIAIISIASALRDRKTVRDLISPIAVLAVLAMMLAFSVLYLRQQHKLLVTLRRNDLTNQRDKNITRFMYQYLCMRSGDESRAGSDAYATQAIAELLTKSTNHDCDDAGIGLVAKQYIYAEQSISGKQLEKILTELRLNEQLDHFIRLAYNIGNNASKGILDDRAKAKFISLLRSEFSVTSRRLERSSLWANLCFPIALAALPATAYRIQPLFGSQYDRIMAIAGLMTLILPMPIILLLVKYSDNMIKEAQESSIQGALVYYSIKTMRRRGINFTDPLANTGDIQSKSIQDTQYDKAIAKIKNLLQWESIAQNSGLNDQGNARHKLYQDLYHAIDMATMSVARNNDFAMDSEMMKAKVAYALGSKHSTIVRKKDFSAFAAGIIIGLCSSAAMAVDSVDLIITNARDPRSCALGGTALFMTAIALISISIMLPMIYESQKTKQERSAAGYILSRAARSCQRARDKIGLFRAQSGCDPTNYTGLISGLRQIQSEVSLAKAKPVFAKVFSQKEMPSVIMKYERLSLASKAKLLYLCESSSIKPKIHQMILNMLCALTLEWLAEFTYIYVKSFSGGFNYTSTLVSGALCVALNILTITAYVITMYSTKATLHHDIAGHFDAQLIKDYNYMAKDSTQISLLSQNPKDFYMQTLKDMHSEPSLKQSLMPSTLEGAIKESALMTGQRLGNGNMLQ